MESFTCFVSAGYTSFYGESIPIEKLFRMEQTTCTTIPDPDIPLPSVEFEEGFAPSSPPRAREFAQEVVAPTSFVPMFIGGWGPALEVAPSQARPIFTSLKLNLQNRKRKCYNNTPYPHRDPKTGYVAPILLRGEEQAVDEEDHFQHTKKRRHDITPHANEHPESSLTSPTLQQGKKKPLTNGENDLGHTVLDHAMLPDCSWFVHGWILDVQQRAPSHFSDWDDRSVTLGAESIAFRPALEDDRSHHDSLSALRSPRYSPDLESFYGHLPLPPSPSYSPEPESEEVGIIAEMI